MRYLLALGVLTAVMTCSPHAGGDTGARSVVETGDPNPAANRVGDPPGGNDQGGDGTKDVAVSANQRSVEDGAYLPLSLSPTVGAVAALIVGQGGYDAARGSAVTETSAEVRVWNRLALRGGVQLSDTTNRLRPNVGARLQVLVQERHAIDGSVSVFYRAEGLTEPEGEIETVISVGRRIGRATVIGNLAYGQDPEGRERDGEVRAGAFVRVARRLHLGLDGRWRFDLGSDASKLKASNEATFDLDIGPVAALTLGPIALLGHAGASVVRRVGQEAQMGIVALGGLGTSF